MKKRIFSILLTLCMVLCIVPTNVFAAEGTGTQYQAIHFNTKPLSSPTRVQNGKNIHFMPNSYIYFGNNGNNPIKWRVLDTDKSNDGKRNGMFMLSENLLDGNVKYDYIHGGSEYNGSDAQQWCKDFAANSNNFSGLEQEAMLPVEKTDNVERNLFDYTWDKCSLTNADKMFFPSIREVIDYIGNYDKAPGFIATDTSGNKGAWWLRSHPTGFTKAAGLIFDTGFVDVDNVNKLHSARPAFNLNKNDIRFISAAAGGKSVEGTNGGLAEIPAYSGNEWKLTLYDSSRRDFRVSTSAVSVTPDGGEISINYNDAKTGNNEYISAILFGQDGNVKYYGRSSTSVFSSNGSKTFRIPAGLAEGEYNFSVFSEQYNGDYKTDYIGNLFSVRFTVEKNPEEQFNLATGERYYFDLSAFDIPGQTNEELPESTLHYVPFIYAGTVNSYVLTTEAYMVAGSSEYASRITDPSLSSYGYTYPHSLFIAEHSVKTWVRWSELSMAGDYIYGKDYQSGGIDYNLRAPTVGSRGNNNGAAPLRNEWDRILDKNSKFIRNWQEYASWGQDTCYSHPYEKNHSLRRGDHRSSPRNIIDDFVCNKGCSYRPVLEIKNADALGKNGLRAVTLNLNGTTLGGEEKIKIAVQSNGSFAAPTSDGLTHPYGNSTGYFAWLGDNNRIYAPGESVPAHVTSLTAQWVKPEEFYLEYGVGDTYYFDLSGENIPGTVDSDLPDTSLHYVPFTYVGTIEAYKLKSSSTGVVEAAEIASKADDPESIYGYTQLHSLFIANYTLTNKVSWKELDQNGLIFGRNYASNGINYTLRAPSMGSTVDTTNGKIFPTNNEWDQILAKAPWYIKNMQIKSDLFLYWGQDTRYNNYGYEYMMLRYEKLTSNLEKDNVTDGAYRPVLEVQNVDALGKNGLKEVILYLGDYYFNDRRGINLMVKNGESFTAPSIDGLSLTDSVSEGVTQWWEDEGGNLYKPGDTVPASVEFLSLTHRYDVTYLPGAYGTGDTVTDAKFDGFYPLRLRDALFTRPGYTQTGWATTDGGERVYGLKDYYYANEVLTLYPVWSPNSYTITFDTDGGSEISPITQDCGSEITAPANPSKTGYTFVGWDKEIPTAMPAENITIKAQWKANSYTITFDTDGGSEISPITQDYGSEITAPANPSKTGYTFVGWDKEIPTAMPAENITIKAQWKANSYTITFDTDGGSEIFPITQDYGSEITAPANPSKTGYTFVGWDKEIPTAMPAENITIKAQWKANSYTITFDTDGGSEISSITQDYGSEITAPDNPSKVGCTFVGWDKEIPAAMPAENITIKAQWKANSYTITFDTDGGSEISPITQDYGSEITAPANPSKTGYTFVGWDKEIPTAMPAENITIKAQWKANSYTITFDTDGGSEISPTTQDYGSEITAPANPSKTGYTFVGWDKEIPTAMPAENITIKAQWKANSYTITFDSDGGSTVESKTLSWNDKVLDGVAEPIRNGYSFIGWKYIDYIVYANTVYAELAADDSVNGITLKAEWHDVEKPTGEIIVSTNRWNKLLNDITFGLFFKETQMVTVNATDNSGEKVKIEYLLSNREITENELADAGFTEYNGSFSIAPDNEYIIYVRLSDTEGNIRHICSDGIVLDGTSPAINGVENGKTYCEAQTVKINEKYVSTVTVNGMAVALDEQDRFVLSPTEREQTIIVTDKAGNTSEITVTVNNGHTYGDWSSNSDGTHTRWCGVDGCQAGVETKNCTDADKNHRCDICGYIISECTDTDKNHICDYCGKAISEHEDEVKDHTCTDKDKNHICDYCGKAISEHENEVKDHTCTDKDKNHICDYCGKAISEHENEVKEIKKANTAAERLPDAPRSPKTGDNNSLILWIALLFISGGTVINTTVVTKKKRHNN